MQQVYVSNRIILTWQRVLQLSSVAVDDVLFSCSNDDQSVTWWICDGRVVSSWIQTSAVAAPNCLNTRTLSRCARRPTIGRQTTSCRNGANENSARENRTKCQYHERSVVVCLISYVQWWPLWVCHVMTWLPDGLPGQNVHRSFHFHATIILNRRKCNKRFPTILF